MFEGGLRIVMGISKTLLIQELILTAWKKHVRWHSLLFIKHHFAFSDPFYGKFFTKDEYNLERI